MFSRLVAVSMLPIVLLGCAADPKGGTRSASTLSPSTKDAYTLLLLGPKDNEVKSCADSSLDLNRGLTFMQMGKAGDEQIETNLRKRHSDRPALRDRQIASWKNARSPSTLAAIEFDDCLQESGIAPGLGELGKSCFGVGQVVATAEVFKGLAYSREKTLAELQKAYGGSVSEKWLKGISDETYEAGSPAALKSLHRRMFAGCIQNAG